MLQVNFITKTPKRIHKIVKNKIIQKASDDGIVYDPQG